MEYDDSGRLVSKRPCGGGGGGGGFPGASALETERSIVEHVLQGIGEKGNGGGYATYAWRACTREGDSNAHTRMCATGTCVPVNCFIELHRNYP